MQNKHARRVAADRSVCDEVEEALDEAMIAELGCQQITQMTCEELVRLIRVSQLPLITPERNRHLPFYDRETLSRLAFLARRCCQNRQRF